MNTINLKLINLIIIFIIFFSLTLLTANKYCTFYDFGINFKSFLNLSEKNYSFSFNGHIKIFEYLFSFLFNPSYIEIFIYFFRYLFLILLAITLIYTIKKPVFIFFILINPFIINPLFFDFHYEYFAVILILIFYFNIKNKYSYFFLFPFIFISETYAFLSIFLYLIYLKYHKLNWNIIFIITLKYVFFFLSVSFLFSMFSGENFFETKNINIKIFYLANIFIVMLITLFLFKRNYIDNFLKDININYIFILIILLNILFYLFFIITSGFKYFYFFSFNNHYMLIVGSILSLILIHNFKYFKFLFKIFLLLIFLITNPTFLGASFWLNEDSNFYYKNYSKSEIIFKKLNSTNSLYLINNKFCDYEMVDLKNTFTLDDIEINKDILNYNIILNDRLSKSELIKFNLMKKYLN